ncbi:hypothetical protein LZ198_34630 [Myxococcus sp. K15C18031901]|uniref:hypothetical protein n=1 Tax=Myxococcus dinghuensis TaxID=2906761 RepID=UPI0020A7FFDB|nr:hypothetical protein [Myxococcus dinghuensis]MCP3104023.1 hypothetical protein [Myxococcus dinghuensis]
MTRVRFSVHRTVGEARLLAGTLESEGMSVEVRGEALVPLTGEIPSGETWVELWLWPGDVEQARAVMAQLQERQEAAALEVECPACHEANPGNFELCWSCGLELPSGLRPRLRAV